MVVVEIGLCEPDCTTISWQATAKARLVMLERGYIMEQYLSRELLPGSSVLCNHFRFSRSDFGLVGTSK